MVKMFDVIGQVLFGGILATPIISFLFVWLMRRISLSEKIILGISITIILAFIFFLVSMSILLRDGLGPI